MSTLTLKVNFGQWFGNFQIEADSIASQKAMEAALSEYTDKGMKRTPKIIRRLLELANDYPGIKADKLVDQFVKDEFYRY